MKIKDILSGTKKRRRSRGSRIARLIGDSLHNPLREGGKVFPDAIPFDHDMIPGIMKSINSVLAKTGSKALPIGSGATPTKGKISGDLDMIVDLGQLKQHFDNLDNKLQNMYDNGNKIDTKIWEITNNVQQEISRLPTSFKEVLVSEDL